MLSCLYSSIQAVSGTFFEGASTTFIAVIFPVIFCLLFGTIFKVEVAQKLRKVLMSYPYKICTVRTCISSTFFEVARTTFNAVIFL